MPRDVVPILKSPRAFSRATSTATCRSKQELGALGDEQPAARRHAEALELVDLVEERLRVDHHAVAEDAAHVGAQDARRDEVQREVAVAEPHGVAGVVAALIAHHGVEGRGDQVDDLPLAFVSPLHAEDDDAGHGLLTDSTPHIARQPAVSVTRFAPWRRGKQRYHIDFALGAFSGWGATGLLGLRRCKARSTPPSCCCRWFICCWRSTTAAFSSPVARSPRGAPRSASRSFSPCISPTSCC